MMVALFFGITFDQATKIVAQSYLASAPPISYLGDVFRFQYMENHGAFLGIGAILPSEARFWLFTIIVALILTTIFVYLVTHNKIDFSLLSSFTLILTGGVSNLIDRIINDGAVIDFMNIGIGSLRTGVFNVADMAIMGGLGIILFSSHARTKMKT